MKEFLEQELYTPVGVISLGYDEEYGKTYHVHTHVELFDMTGVEGVSMELGNFGLVKRANNRTYSELEDNFILAKVNPRLFKKYIMLVSKSNMIDGEPVRIQGKTYRESFIAKFSEFIANKKRKSSPFSKIAKRFKGNNNAEYMNEGVFDNFNYERLLQEINQELIQIEQCESELGA